MASAKEIRSPELAGLSKRGTELHRSAVARLMRMVRRKDCVLAVALIAVILLVYMPCWHGNSSWDDDWVATARHVFGADWSWHGTWLWDDDWLLLNNPVLKPSGLAKVWKPPGYVNYWPLTYTVYWIEFQLWGLRPVGYHLINIALHAVAVLLVWRVLRQLRLPGAFFAAAIFALHPVSVEAVAWIAQLKTVLSLVLALISLLLYLSYDRKGGRWRYAAAIAAFVLSALSKGDALTLPIVILALAWWQRGRIKRRDVLLVLPYALIGVCLAALEVWTQRHAGSEIVRSDGIFSRTAIAGCAVWFYLWKLVWPQSLIPFYPRWPLPAANFLWYLPSLMLLVALGVGWWRRGTWGRPAVMLIVCYVALLLPVLGFANITFMKFSLVADHWQYIAMIVPCAVFASAATAIAGRCRCTTLLRVGCVALLLLLSALSWLQSRLYLGIDAFFEGTLARNPACSSAEVNFGLALARRGETDSAMAHYRRALQIDPGSWLAVNNIGVVLADRGDIRTAATYYAKALELNPDYADAHSNLGAILLDEGKFDSAESHLKRALEIHPDVIMANYNLALVFEKRGELDLAIPHLQRELEIEPDFELARKMLAAANARREQLVKALDEVRDRLRRAPADADLLDQGAWILSTSPYASVRNGAQAVELAERARKITGDDPKNLGTLAAAYAEAGQFPSAVRTAERAIRLAEIAGNYNLAEQISSCLVQYRNAKPFRDLQ